LNYFLIYIKFIIGNYHCIGENNETLFRIFETPKEKERLITNADNAVQSYWNHIHHDSNHAPSHFKGFNYKPSGKILSLFYKYMFIKLKYVKF
jgi:hypothetical protein